MKVMKIFEPAMCCSTGLCGVSVDPELLRISAVLNTLKNNGVTVNRFNLSSDPQEFVNDQVVNTYIKENGVAGLPVVTLDGAIKISGRYPSNDEFIHLLEVPSSYVAENPSITESSINKDSCCECSGGDCC